MLINRHTLGSVNELKVVIRELEVFYKYYVSAKAEVVFVKKLHKHEFCAVIKHLSLS